MSDRLDPVILRRDAARMLNMQSADPVALVASLLRQIRQDDDTHEHIRIGYQTTTARVREDLELARHYALRDAARMVHEMRPANNTQVTYDGAQGQAERLLRNAAKWSLPIHSTKEATP